MSREEDLKYADLTAAIKRRFDPILTEPIPARMYLKSPPWIDYARAASVLETTDHGYLLRVAPADVVRELRVRLLVPPDLLTHAEG